MIPKALRSAYERGRMRDAVIHSVVVAAIVGVLLVAAGRSIPQLVLGAVLVVVFLISRWRGMSWAQGAAVGVFAGVVAALGPSCVVMQGGACVGPGCTAIGEAVCAIGGVVAGVVIGLRARDRRALVAATVVAVLESAIGCWPFGLAAAAGTGATLLAGTCCARVVRGIGTSTSG